jgi:hypothetical protein
MELLHSRRESVMPSSVKICAALCALLACACSSGPEVVATQRQKAAPSSDASSLFNLTAVSKCEPGQYNGNFSSNADADGAPNFGLEGDFTFELVQQLHGEFLSLANGAQLTGHSTTSDVSFSATILSGGTCRDGAFPTSTLEGGQFTVGGGASLPFKGTVGGQYSQQFFTFNGWWNVLLNNTSTTVEGNWSATLNRSRP